MPRWVNLSNLLTLLRLALVPWIFRAILHGEHFTALAVFSGAALTDILDGAAARRFGWSTQVGADLDPIADKCLMSGVFLALALARIVPWWFVAVVFGRDIYILLAVGVLLLFTPVRKFPPSVWGKVSTFVQIVTAILWLASDFLEIGVLNSLSALMLWPCMAFTLWSGIHYTWR